MQVLATLTAMTTEESVVGAGSLVAAIVALVGGFAFIGKWLMDNNKESFRTIVTTNDIQNKALASTAESLKSIGESLSHYDRRLGRIERKLGIDDND